MAAGYSRLIESWPSGSLGNIGCILACEVAGPSTGSRGIHVIADPSRVMVRYILLHPRGFRAPAAKDIVPAIQIVCAALRSGSV